MLHAISTKPTYTARRKVTIMKAMFIYLSFSKIKMYVFISKRRHTQEDFTNSYFTIFFSRRTIFVNHHVI